LLTASLTLSQLPQLANSTIEKATKGAYVLEEVANGSSAHRLHWPLADSRVADVTLISTGSEVPLCLEALQQLKEQGIKARLVSMPCMEVFVSQQHEL
jgi:transketolase